MKNLDKNASPTATRYGVVLAAVLLGGLLVGCRETSADRSTDAASESMSDDELRDLIDEVLDFTEQQRELSSERHAAWQILHGVLAFGPDFEIAHDGQTVNTLDWVLGGGNMRGWTMRRGSVGLKAILELGSKAGQGHEDQWLAVISQCDVPADQPIKVGEDEYTMDELVRQAKHDVFEGKECSWTLIGLSQYVPMNEEWKAGDGETWSLERIMAMEAGEGLNPDDAEYHINMAACGGSHRLIGMTMALDRYLQTNPEAQPPEKLIRGGWLAAKEQIDWAIKMAKENQLPSGAFSVSYFERSTNSVDLAEHLGATGHTLEFLSLALDNDELREPWVTRAAVHLCKLFQKTEQIDLECGALYHAAHGLVLYRERRFGPRDTLAPGESPGAK